MSEQVYAYRGLCQHGKVRAMAVDPNTGTHGDAYKEDAPEEIASWLRAGLSLDRVTIEDARKSDMDCPECDIEES